jgi:hypothetical protein
MCGEGGSGMNEEQVNPTPNKLPAGAYSLDALNVVVEGNEDTTVRPITPEEIAAIKRYWERQGRKPPPPYDKL